MEGGERRRRGTGAVASFFSLDEPPTVVVIHTPDGVRGVVGRVSRENLGRLQVLVLGRRALGLRLVELQVLVRRRIDVGRRLALRVDGRGMGLRRRSVRVVSRVRRGRVPALRRRRGVRVGVRVGMRVSVRRWRLRGGRRVAMS